MKNTFCLILLLASVSCYYKEKDNLKRNYDIQRYENNEENYKFQTKSDKEYIGNPDYDAKIERPCRVYDLNCIRKFFAEHSKCKIRRSPLPRTLPISQETLYYSRVNSSVMSINFRIDGFRNTRIEEFYINRRTNKMVLSIQMREFTKTSPNVYFVIYRNGREPIVLLTEAMDFFPSVTYTAIIPHINDLELDKAEITAYADAVPGFVIGPEVANNTNPVVIQTLAEFLADTQINTQELILTDAYLFVPAYIQYNICDFGLNNL